MTETGDPPIKAGDIIAGKYRAGRLLGAGGMGFVLEATHIHLEQRVALKFLLPECLGNADTVQRFAREAKAAAMIQSEHVARVLDVATLDNGTPYMVLEFLQGSDLGDLIKKRGRLEIGEAVEYVLQALEALAEAHVAGIVHRDLKPANLFLTQRADGSPCVKILDFGISKLAPKDGVQASMTKTSALMGTPLYMAPEQMRGSKQMDARTDIWALGIILYELVTGNSPFLAETMPELIATILDEPPPPIARFLPGAPPALERIILRCLEKRPNARFQNVGELAWALAELAPPQSRLSIERVVRVTGAAPMGSAPMGAAPMSASAPQWGPPSQGVAPMQYSGQTGPGYAGAAMQSGSAIHGATNQSWGATGKSPSSTRVGVYIAIGIGALFGLVGLVAMISFRHHDAANSVSGSSSVTAVVPAANATASAHPTTTATPSVNVEPSPEIPSAAPLASASAAPSAVAKPASTAAPHAQPRPGIPTDFGGRR